VDPDARRTATLGVACAAFVLVPNAGALFGEGEQSDQ
jgi:hypothetical protein